MTLLDRLKTLTDQGKLVRGDRFEHAVQLTDRVMLIPLRANTTQRNQVGKLSPQLRELPPAWEVLVETDREPTAGGMGSGGSRYQSDTYPIANDHLGVGYIRADGTPEVRVNYHYGHVSGVTATVELESDSTAPRELASTIIRAWRDNRQAFKRRAC